MINVFIGVDFGLLTKGFLAYVNDIALVGNVVEPLKQLGKNL